MNITIVITTFNRRRKVCDAIGSTLVNFPNASILVIDDASQDTTCEWVNKRYQNSIADGKIRYIRLARNHGVTAAKNIGYMLASTGWVGFLDSDDYFVEGAGRIFCDFVEGCEIEPALLFFASQYEDGSIVNTCQTYSLRLTLAGYLSHSSFGEAITFMNKKLIKMQRPYVSYLRGYEGIGCSRIIHEDFGATYYCGTPLRVYVQGDVSQLSTGKNFYSRLATIGKGHQIMAIKFGSAMSCRVRFLYMLKAKVYQLLGLLLRQKNGN